MSTRRFADEPAFVLHRYDWSETSLVLEVFTRHHGRIALVGKGVKRPTSQFRPVLLPLQPLQITWTGDAEVRTLKAAHWVGGHVMPTGEALIAGGYLNELLMRLLARDDPHPGLFDHFTTAAQLLAERPQTQAVVVRTFELLLLRDAGFLPDLASEGQTFTPLDGATGYVLQPESGLRAAHGDDHHPLRGAHWLALQAALDQPAPFVPTMKACAEVASALRIPLRNLLHYHGGVRVFRTRQLLLDVQALGRHRGSAPNAERALSMAHTRTALSVNLNKVALVRNTRHLGIPSVTRAAALCLQAGAAGITVHPRPDERHIRAHDVHELSALLKAWPDREFNIEGNPFHNLMDFVRALRPQQATFVPDAEGQFTSDHGWRFPGDAERLHPLIAECKALGVRVSLFMDAEPDQMVAARAVGADRVELYTEPYAAAHGTPQGSAQLLRFASAAKAALDAGLAVNAGHDLNRDNLGPFLRAVPGVSEVSIGHALIADALELGYDQTIRAYQRCIDDAFR